MRGFALGAAVALGACAHRPPPPDALLIIRVEPTLSQVLVNDQPVGRDVQDPARVRVAVRGGTYRVEVRAPGYFTAYREVFVPARGQRDERFRLRADPDEGRPELPMELLTGPR